MTVPNADHLVTHISSPVVTGSLVMRKPVRMNEEHRLDLAETIIYLD